MEMYVKLESSIACKWALDFNTGVEITLEKTGKPNVNKIDSCRAIRLIEIK